MFFGTLKAPSTKVFLFQPITTQPSPRSSTFLLTNPHLRASPMPTGVHKTNPSIPPRTMFPSSTADQCPDTFNGSTAHSIGHRKDKLLQPEAQLKQKYMPQMNAPRISSTFATYSKTFTFSQRSVLNQRQYITTTTPAYFGHPT